MPDWDNAERRESDEDAAWRDLIARFDEPAPAAEPAPWPEREDVHAPRPRPQAGTRGPGTARGAEGVQGFDDDGVRGALAGGTQPYEAGPYAAGPYEAGPHEAGPYGTGPFEGEQAEPDVIEAAWRPRPAADRGRAPGAPADDEDDHFVPPAPPPLPKLDPVTKGAWVALFGGPGYLVVATALGWTVPGLAAFCAVAAFVAGFAVLVLRMHDADSGDSDDGDDGAVL